ncbi:MAG: putative 4-hydroxybenzoate polyprenyltransferase [Proteobacteria bacterium]|nr:putative 4-hydroxybenzoate polyprenyltransferase [Pseudomonadota bacterium]MBU1584080.1 putative 4-hydroxybenzoate polyprenyltransferase [Pseudomonadota bacterium]MBU2455186.1 putative 4-hydroxybenzoate polyprenyltransferase [Pseudomonadota bacterium]MBU2630767.1 putative 4-hydroxybenzoate polyprenyltransferase [Pseudomonadota bacterium]
MNSGLKNKILVYGRMIKFSHTIFALPFALSAVVMAWEKHSPSVGAFVFILVAMVSARSAAMGFNRIVDAEIDLKNERTAIREIPSGLLSKKESFLFVLFSSLVFIFSAAMLSHLCFILSFPVLFFLMFYSYTKRFTKYCHLYLGFAISLAPVGAWVAIAGTLSWSVIFLSLGLMTYIAGFDILYSCQDIDFDKNQGLFSLPSKIGPEKAMLISSIFHVGTIVFLFSMYIAFGMHPVFLVFLSSIGMLLILEHRLVKPDNLTHINIAFFHVNSVISVLLFIGVLTQGFLK